MKDDHDVYWLFQDEEGYSDVALELDHRGRVVVLPLFEECGKRGYSLCDIALILSHCMHLGEAIFIVSKKAFWEHSKNPTVEILALSNTWLNTKMAGCFECHSCE